MLDANRFEERLDRKLIVRLAGHRFADQSGVSQGVRGIAAAGARIKSQLRRALITAMAKDVFPRAVVGRARRFRTNPRGVIEQLPDGDLRFARIAQRLRPWDEIECQVVEFHPSWCQALLALL